ncbi:hypothetical protein N9W89_01110 [Hellea sp.]|nr:hypothetical protein [Hellea sp.]
MTKLEDFINYAKTLSPEDLKVLEWQLEGLMKADNLGLTAEQLQDVETRRRKTPKIYATDEQVESLLGEPLNP